ATRARGYRKWALMDSQNGGAVSAFVKAAEKTTGVAQKMDHSGRDLERTKQSGSLLRGDGRVPGRGVGEQRLALSTERRCVCRADGEADGNGRNRLRDAAPPSMLCSGHEAPR